MREERELIKLLKILIVLMIIWIVVEMKQCSKVNAAVVAQEISYGGYHAPQKDIELLAEVMYHENWHTDKEHLAAYYTGAVVMNRVYSKWWPNTVESVLYQKGQYSTTGKFFTKELPQECYDMAKDILECGTPVPRNVIFQAMFKQGHGVWKVVNTDYFCYE
jgi:hypothetical protein